MSEQYFISRHTMPYVGVQVYPDDEAVDEATFNNARAEYLETYQRQERDKRIAAVRWRIERHQDEVLMGQEPSEPLAPILEYIQALRDIPQQAGFPLDITWPQEP